MSFVPTLRLLPEFEDELKRLPGIIAASVVTGADAVPTEIHVLADRARRRSRWSGTSSRSPWSSWDLDIDHRIVSVVQIGADEMPTLAIDEPDLAEPAPRPAISSIMVRTSGAEAEAVVTVTATGGRVFEGRIVGPATATHRSRLVAQATLAALDELLGSAVVVENAQVVTAGSRQVALSVLSVTVPRLGEQYVSGSALVRGDESDAVARSVLAALNRGLAS